MLQQTFFTRDTMRFLAACAALEGLLANPNTDTGPKLIAEVAVQYGDALMAELYNPPPDERG